MPANIPLRHELKFFISEMQYQVLSRQLDRVLWRDPNGDENNEYHIRSLYFDTIFDDALFDKLDGVQNRNKYRIRIYNFSDRLIKLECKTKVGSLISKRSLTISPFDNNEIILEVKYNRVMPPYIRDLLCTYCPGAVQSAISKYTWCRRYEDKEA